MTRIILSGSNGQMGQTITQIVSDNEDLTIVAGISLDGQALNYYPVYKNILECKEMADIILDFSNATTLEDTLNFAKTNKIPLLIATTGHTYEQIVSINEVAKVIPVFKSGNMSLGVNLLISLAKKTARILGDDFDIEIIESHHNKKVDAPSGTAIMIADAINGELKNKADYIYDRHSRHEKREKQEIGIHSIRGGTQVGEHTVMFFGNHEIVELKHKADSRELFARGAIEAMPFIIKQKPGKVYDMSDVINQ